MLAMVAYFADNQLLTYISGHLVLEHLTSRYVSSVAWICVFSILCHRVCFNQWIHGLLRCHFQILMATELSNSDKYNVVDSCSIFSCWNRYYNWFNGILDVLWSLVTWIWIFDVSVLSIASKASGVGVAAGVCQIVNMSCFHSYDLIMTLI